MRYILFLFFISISIFSFAQIPDYTDMRSNRESFNRMSDKIIRNDLTAFTIGGIAESVNKPVLQKFPVSKYGDDFITYDSNNFQVTIKTKTFFVAKHKLMYDGDGKYLVKIDNKPYYGNYTKVPQSGISLIVLAGKDTVAIPPSAYADLYNPHFTYRTNSGELQSQDAVFISADKHRIYVYMLNKDDHGSYEVTWIFQDNKYLRRVLDYGFTP
jgi:hypothetical protein